MALEFPAVNRRLYVIGDIHGRSDLLDRMVDRIHGDMFKSGSRGSPLTITLGDYVDRGPDSRGVLDRLSRNPFPGDYVALKGNHESLFESFMSDSATADSWRRFGGLETLFSYGIATDEVMRGEGFAEAAAALRANIPKEHLDFLASLKPYFIIGDYYFCHAGVRPRVPLSQQKIDDLLWIRDEFLDSTEDFGKMIIHGHTPNEWPEVKRNRVNIDTGAFATGRLTCLVIGEEGKGHFIFTG
jgi:serine/threonine protein phosphatase 1